MTQKTPSGEDENFLDAITAQAYNSAETATQSFKRSAQRATRKHRINKLTSKYRKNVTLNAQQSRAVRAVLCPWCQVGYAPECEDGRDKNRRYHCLRLLSDRSNVFLYYSVNENKKAVLYNKILSFVENNVGCNQNSITRAIGEKKTSTMQAIKWLSENGYINCAEVNKQGKKTYLYNIIKNAYVEESTPSGLDEATAKLKHEADVTGVLPTSATACCVAEPLDLGPDIDDDHEGLYIIDWPGHGTIARGTYDEIAKIEQHLCLIEARNGKGAVDKERRRMWNAIAEDERKERTKILNEITEKD